MQAVSQPGPIPPCYRRVGGKQPLHDAILYEEREGPNMANSKLAKPALVRMQKAILNRKEHKEIQEKHPRLSVADRPFCSGLSSAP
jgi:hypothetical protein